jgi:phospholipase/lecithinase/hemolysin
LLLGALQRNDGSGSNIFGTNYAWGGSTSGSGKTDLLINNLQTQIGNYVSILNGTPTGQPDPSTTLYTVWSGGNDVIDLVTDGTQVTPQQIAGNIGSAINSLYNVGGRTFLVPNLPPLGDKPNFLNTPNEAPANTFVNSYNPVLEAELTNLESQLSGIVIIRLDIYTLFTDVLANPGAYGFSNVTQSAYVWDSNAPNGGYVNPDPNSYLFWDGTHPTLAGHQLIGDLAYDAVVAVVPEPGTVFLFLLGGAWLTALAYRRRVGARMIERVR